MKPQVKKVVLKEELYQKLVLDRLEALSRREGVPDYLTDLVSDLHSVDFRHALEYTYFQNHVEKDGETDYSIHIIGLDAGGEGSKVRTLLLHKLQPLMVLRNAGGMIKRNIPGLLRRQVWGFTGEPPRQRQTTPTVKAAAKKRSKKVPKKKE